VSIVHCSLFNVHCPLSIVRFAAWRSGGLLAQMFNRKNALELSTKLSYKALHRHYAKPMLAAALLSLSSVCQSFSVGFVCALAWWLFCKTWLWRGLVRFCKCATKCVGLCVVFYEFHCCLFVLLNCDFNRLFGYVY
jgi:hypothetical protein